MKMITAIIKPFKLDDVRDAIAETGIHPIAGPGTVGQFTLAQKVLQQLLNGDMDAAWAEYNAALGTPREPELPSDLAINQIGYPCLLDGEIDTANGVFTLNVEAHPEAYNTWDSLGEAYMEAGEKLKAIECYRNSLELNPDNDNGVKMLKKLDAD